MNVVDKRNWETIHVYMIETKTEIRENNLKVHKKL